MTFKSNFSYMWQFENIADNIFTPYYLHNEDNMSMRVSNRRIIFSPFVNNAIVGIEIRCEDEITQFWKIKDPKFTSKIIKYWNLHETEFITFKRHEEGKSFEYHTQIEKMYIILRGIEIGEIRGKYGEDIFWAMIWEHFITNPKSKLKEWLPKVFEFYKKEIRRE